MCLCLLHTTHNSYYRWYMCALHRKWIESKRIYRIWNKFVFFIVFCTFPWKNHRQNERIKKKWTRENKIRNSPLKKCHKKALKWNGKFFSLSYTSGKKNKRVLYPCTRTTREFNDNRKMVFPCFYLNMLSHNEVLYVFFLVSNVVDNIFYLVWQASFFPFKFRNRFVMCQKSNHSLQTGKVCAMQ